MSEKSRDCTKFFFDWVFSWSFNSLRKLQSPDFFGVVAELLPGIRRFGMSWPPFNDDLPGWLLRSISYVGGALLGPVFLAGSIVALRNRKRAGIIFLICKHAGCSFLSWISICGISRLAADGGGSPTAIGLTTIFFLPIFAALLAIRYRKLAVYLFAPW
jgi:hypothetical protein